MACVVDAEDWAALGQSTVRRRMCAVCGAGIVERASGYPAIFDASSLR